MTKTEKWMIGVLMLMILVAFLLNLGDLPLRTDEAIRSTVALEMMKSDNYVVPTIWGEFYYRKPPLYNWVIIGFFWLFDSFSLFVYRLPSVLALFGIAVATWFVSRKHIGQRASIFAGFMFLLSGSVITRESLLGYIDPLFSLVTFMGFFTVFHFHRKQAYWPLFLISYLLAAAGVLLKGLPSFLFQGLTLVSWFTYKRDWRSLFKPAHFAGMALFALIVGGYFYLYSEYNSLDTYFEELYGQASMRTVAEHPWYDSVFKFIIFPLENIWLLFPTSLFALFIFRRGMLREWMRDDFTAFIVVTLAINIIPYWLSPGYRFRYLMMLYPLFLILGAQAYLSYRNDRAWLRKSIEWVFLIASAVITIGVLYPLFDANFAKIPGLYLKTAVLFILGAAITWSWFKWRDYRHYVALAVLLFFRIAFDVFVIYHRVEVEDEFAIHQMREAKKVLDVSEDLPITVWENTPLSRDMAFYLGRDKDMVIHRIYEPVANTLIILDDRRLGQLQERIGSEVEVRYSFDSMYEHYHMNAVVIRPDQLAKWPFQIPTSL